MGLTHLLVFAPLLAVVGAIGAARAPAPGAAEALFHGDPPLDVPLVFAERDRPLNEFLASLQRRLRLPLSASPETADEQVTLFLKQVPVGAALTLVARHFDFEWRRSGKGYRLVQPAASRRREAERRAHELARQLADLRAQTAGLAALAGVSRVQLEAEERSVVARLADPQLPKEEATVLRRRQQALVQARLVHGAVPMSAALGALDAVQTRALLDGAEVRLSSRDGSLPARLVELAHAAAAEHWRQRPRTRKATAPGLAYDVLPPVDAEVAIRLREGDLREPIERGDRPLELRFQLTSVRGHGDQQAAAPFGWSVRGEPLPEPERPSRDDDPVLRREVQLELPRPVRAAPPPSAGALLMGSWPPRPTMSDAAEAFQRATALDVIADSFVRARPEAALITARAPLVQTLDRLAGALNYEWQVESGRLVLRSRIRFHDRRYAVPARVVRPWLERVTHSPVGEATLDDLAGLATSLSDLQVRGMDDYWGWYLDGPRGAPQPPGRGFNGFYSLRQHLRFWSALAPAQRRAALAGEFLPAERLTPAQQRAFAAALNARPEIDLPRPPEPAPSPADLLAGGFALHGEPMLEQLFVTTTPEGSPISTAQRYSPGDDPQSSLANIREGLVWEPRGGSVPVTSYGFRYYLRDRHRIARHASIVIAAPEPRQ